jgi:hypothetical protein
VTIRSYSIDFSKPEDAARTTVNMHRDTLISLRSRTPDPEGLEWEIRIYDYILEDPLPRYEAYSRARIPVFGKPPVNKRKVIEQLGWIIP